MAGVGRGVAWAAHVHQCSTVRPRGQLPLLGAGRQESHGPGGQGPPLLEEGRKNKAPGAMFLPGRWQAARTRPWGRAWLAWGGTGVDSPPSHPTPPHLQVEMFVVCTPAQSEALHAELVALEAEMFEELGLHFKVGGGTGG